MGLQLDENSKKIIDLLNNEPGLSSSEIHEKIKPDHELITTKRNLSRLVEENLLATEGAGRGTRYVISPYYRIFMPIDIGEYFSLEQDERKILNGFNFDLIPHLLPELQLFTAREMEGLKEIQSLFNDHIAELPDELYESEMERLGIDLSWKSSQIEGNTYSLLETELLFKESIEAKGKKKEEAIMLLNHKKALYYILDQPLYMKQLSVRNIEEVHSLLVENLKVDRNIRKRSVGITGTNYRPLDNDHQIREALTEMCALINQRKDAFEQAFLALVLISYIQPFADGNKRTARIICNALLIANAHCPLSFRTVDSLEYKKAMLLFYEQNNINALKKMFIEQYEFAVNTYFL